MIQENYEQAQLSLAAYALGLTPNISEASYIEKLVVIGMSKIQATEFANTYKIIDQFTDSTSGFSGTIFEKNDGTRHVAIRGTEGPDLTDWLANVADVGADGIAIGQGIAMMNWLQQLYTDPTQPDQLIQYIYHKEILESTNGVVQVTPAWIETTSSSELMSSFGLLAKQTEKMSVTGHSLGGHLAIMLSRLAPGKINSVYTYNPPGFDSLLSKSPFALTSEGFYDAFQAAFATPTTGSIGNTWNLSIMETFIVESDTVHKIGNLPETQIIFSEGNKDGPIDSHDIKAIVDSLAVAKLFADVSPSITLKTVNSILRSSSNDNWDSLENAVESLYELFVNPNTPIQIAKGDKENLYKFINEIKNNPNYQFNLNEPNMPDSTFFVDLSEFSDASIILNNAKNYIAYRYAVVNLDPFVFLGDSSIYNQHNQNNELDIYNSENDTGTITDQYLIDRVKMLQMVLKFAEHDYPDKKYIPNESSRFYKDYETNLEFQNGSTSSNAASKYIFGDAGNNTDISGGGLADHLYGGAGNDTINGLVGNDYIEGNQGNDTLNGDEGNDHLLGGKGVDVLNGGEDNDRLEGGLENDLYIFEGNFGEDTVIDSGTDTLLIDGEVLSVAFDNGSGQFKTLDGKYTLTKNGTNLLVDAGAGNKITLVDWQEGGYGIQLKDKPADIPVPTIDQTYIDDDGTDNFIYNYLGTQNWSVNMLSGDDRAFGGGGSDYILGSTGDDALFGRGGNDVILGQEDNDIIQGNDGTDRLHGGKGNDRLWGGSGNDILAGDEGTDVLIGHRGDDILFADEQVDINNISSIDNGTLSLARDWLTGFSGDDILIGNNGQNFIDGGSGKDIIYANGGNDFIFGDKGWAPVIEETNGTLSVTFDWTVNYDEATRTFNFGPLLGGDNYPEDDGADVIYAGSGRDYVWAGGGMMLFMVRLVSIL